MCRPQRAGREVRGAPEVGGFGHVHVRRRRWYGGRRNRLDAAVAVDSGGSASSWASGGTKSMTGFYPDPFVTPAAVCAVLVAATEGPCTEAADQVRKDVSEGYGGLPVRLARGWSIPRAVRSRERRSRSGTPRLLGLLGEYAQQWHVPQRPGWLRRALLSRGVQTTRRKWALEIDTCFPGWYRGRAIHIHYTVALGRKVVHVAALSCFDQTLLDNEIFTTHAEYKGFGLPEYYPECDRQRGGERNLATYLLETKRMDRRRHARLEADRTCLR